MLEMETKWYVIHTYSGHENKVKANIEKMVDNRNLHDLIREIVVPMETHVEVKDGKRIEKERKMFPGYVIVNMAMTDESWYIVRNTRGVTSFVGPASKPIPLTEAELKNMGLNKLMLNNINLEVGQNIRIVSGPFDDTVGTVIEDHPDKQMAKVMVSIFGRETPVEIEYSQVEKL